MVGREDVDPSNVILQGTANSGYTFARNLVIRKFTSCLGNAKRIVQYGADGKILSETINHYLHDDLENLSFHDFMTQYKARLSNYKNQGFLQERYSEIKKINLAYVNPNVPSGWYVGSDYRSLGGVKATMSAREEYPCIQTGQTVNNYVNGTQTSTQNLAFDMYSGAVTKKVETDAYGNNIMTQTVPAYRVPSYGSMGLKINNDANLNMLTQVAETYVYKMDNNPAVDPPLGLVSATVNTWGDQVPALDVDGSVYTQNNNAVNGPGDIWRPQSSYSWMPTTQTTDGLTPMSSFPTTADFNFANPSTSDSRWMKTSDITLYDVYSKSLEARDVNGNYAATHMTYGENKVLLTGSPAGYYEIAYSGAEDAGVNQTNTGFISKGSGVVTSGAGKAHTGTQSLLLGSGGQQAFIYSTTKLVTGKSYTASVWVKPVSGTTSKVNLYYNVNGGTGKVSSVSSATSTKTAGSWTLVNLLVNGSDVVNGATINIWCENDDPSIQVYVDDMRIQPLNATTTAYVYDPFSGELTDVLDNNNLYTRFEYDAEGRLVRTYKEKLAIGEFKTHQNTYNYGTPKYGNDPINGTYTKSNCNPYQGYGGSAQTVVIPANTYTSFISTSDADRIAGIYAQDYANVNGSCICKLVFNSLTSSGPPTEGTFNVSGSRVNFEIDFTNTTASTDMVVGNISGSCGLPSSTRTIPIIMGSGAVYNVLIYPNGNAEVQWVSGNAPDPTKTLILKGVYDLNANLFYSAAESGTFTKACTPPAVGNSITYTVPAYTYVATDQTTANNLAIADVQANGQNYANTSPLGTCTTTTSCPFTWASGISAIVGTISSSGTTGSFRFNFQSPSNGYTGGTIGTFSGGCLPASQQTVTVTDAADATKQWNVTIFPSGSVQINLISGSGETTSSTIRVNGTYNLN